MLLRSTRNRRKGSVLVEYALLIAGIALTAVLSVAVLGHKTFHVFALAAVIMPGASPDDNQPIRHVQTIPLNTHGQDGVITLAPDRLVGTNGGVDRFIDVFGVSGAGDNLIKDLDH